MFKKILQGIINLFAWLRKNKPVIDVILTEKEDSVKTTSNKSKR
jgi:hypothetical protein